MRADIVLGLLIDADGRVLLGKRAATKRAYPGLWDAIGGHREAGETIAAALVREMREELGVTPEVFDALATFAEPDRTRQGDNFYHLFVVTGWSGGEPSNCAPAEHDAIAWFTAGAFAALHDVALVAEVGRMLLARR